MKSSRTKRSRRSKNIVPNLEREHELNAQYRVIAGVDEVGRGAWAGPLVAAAVVLKTDRRIYRIRDSKQLSYKQRQKIAAAIKRKCRNWAVGVAQAKELNRIRLSAAIKLAQTRAVRKLRSRPNYVLVDGNGRHKVDRIKTEHIVKADQKVLSVAAASIIAKVHRDKLMAQLAKQFPYYHFDQNKGYGTKFHHQTLKKHGICREHRVFYKPLKMFFKSATI